MEVRVALAFCCVATGVGAGLGSHAAEDNPVQLRYRPAPVDNPLRGLVPYVSTSAKARFPHSMEFRYFSLRDLLPAPGTYDWSPIEKTLEEVSRRGNQLIFRVFCEYPGKGIQIPRFLIERGVRVTEWMDDNGMANHTPDYASRDLREALVEFIGAMGKKYDGDPRVAFLTAGMLGKWGEWHNYPREELWAGKEVQVEVMEALEKSFRKTHVLLRYPADEQSYRHAANGKRPFGYHDDSFAWATLDTGRPEDSWHFESVLKAAGADRKWHRHPIGGEIRPELWKTSFTGRWHARAQDFDRCVRRTRASWLMDTGLFDVRFPLDEDRRQNALFQTSHLGYELHLREAEWKAGYLFLTVENLGVAPFYYNWNIELQPVQGRGLDSPPDWDLRTLLPGKPAVWKTRIPRAPTYRLRIPNPMEGGKPLRLANEEQGEEWLHVEMEPRRFVKDWQMEDLHGLLGAGLEGGRDFASGRRMFAVGRCYLCHRFGREGGSGGPALGGLSEQFSPHDLLESIVAPGKAIRDRYAASVFSLKTGEEVVGRRVHGEGAAVRIVTDLMSPATITSLKADEIASVKVSPDSMMPSGLLATMTDMEILDLLAYLLSDGDPEHHLFKN